MKKLLISLAVAQVIAPYAYAQYTESQTIESSTTWADGSTITLTNPNRQSHENTGLYMYRPGSNVGDITFNANKLKVEVTGDPNKPYTQGQTSPSITGINVYEGTITNIGEGSSVKVEAKDNYSNILNGSIKPDAIAIDIKGDLNGDKNKTIIFNFKGSKDNRNRVELYSEEFGSGIHAIGEAQVNIENTDIVYNVNYSTTPTWGVAVQGQGRDPSLNWGGGTTTINLINTTINSNRDGIAASNNAEIILTGNNKIVAKYNAIDAEKYGRIVVKDQAHIEGDIYTQQNSSISMDLAQGSYLKGKIYGYNTFHENTSQTALRLSGTVWDMTDNSYANQLILKDNSVINFKKEDGFGELAIISVWDNYNALVGDGTAVINMRVDLDKPDGEAKSDKLIIKAGDFNKQKASTDGIIKLGILNQGSANATGDEIVTLVETRDTASNGNKPVYNNAEYILNNNANKVELGAYEYQLRKVDGLTGKDVELFSDGKRRTTTAEAATSFINIGYLINIIENQTLLQRLGELRNGPQLEMNSGLWSKVWGGKLSSFSGSLSGFDMKYYGLQAGYDKVFNLKNGDLVVGAMAGYTRSSPDYRDGSGKGKNLSFGIYGTYYTDNDVYVDALLKYNHIKNEFNVFDTAGQSINGTGKTHGVSFSVEAGRRYWMQQQRKGLYIEPQVQVTLAYQNGDTVHSSNGLRVKMDSYNSSHFRLSGLVGYQWADTENPSNIYFKAGFVREMSGSTKYQFNDKSLHDYSFRGNWLEMGIGANINLNKQHNISAELDYYKGHKFDNLRAQLHYRYDF